MQLNYPTQAPGALRAMAGLERYIKAERSLEDGLLHLIRYYTKEAGVRGLEREIAKLARKVVKEQALDSASEHAAVEIQGDDIEAYNGVRKFTYGLAEEENQVGIAFTGYTLGHTGWYQHHVPRPYLGGREVTYLDHAAPLQHQVALGDFL